MAVVYFASPAHLRVSAFAVASGIFGLLGTVLAIVEDRLKANFPKLTAILASAAFFYLLASVLFQEYTRQ